MSCFALLRDNVPSWISDVNQLSVHVHNKRAEFAAEAAKSAASPPRRRKSTSSSLHSNRSQKSLLEPPSAAPTTTHSHRLKRFLSRDSLRTDGARKRTALQPEASASEQPPTTAGSAATTTTPSEKRQLRYVISYDGHTQKALEKMVRDIWTAKSSIRSSRIQSSMRTAFGDRMRMQIPVQKRSNEKLASAADETEDKKAPIEAAIEADEEGADAEDPVELRMFRMKQRHRQYLSSSRLRPQPLPPASDQQRRPKQDPYDFIEAQLDSVQTLCETAAYRFLRVGNCLEELESISRAYEFILEAASSMAEKKEIEQARADAEAEAAADDDASIVVDDGDIEIDAEIAVAPASNLNDKDIDLDDSKNAVLEVDDRSDASDIDIDITAFRITRHGQRTMAPCRIRGR